MASVASADDGRDAWLRYRPLSPSETAALGVSLPATIVSRGGGEVLRSAIGELTKGIEGFTGHRPAPAASRPGGGTFVVGTFESLRQLMPEVSSHRPQADGDDGFWIATSRRGTSVSIVVAGDTERGADSRRF